MRFAEFVKTSIRQIGSLYIYSAREERIEYIYDILTYLSLLCASTFLIATCAPRIRHENVNRLGRVGRPWSRTKENAMDARVLGKAKTAENRGGNSSGWGLTFFQA
jgi:hypothetical protein